MLSDDSATTNHYVAGMHDCFAASRRQMGVAVFTRSGIVPILTSTSMKRRSEDVQPCGSPPEFSSCLSDEVSGESPMSTTTSELLRSVETPVDDGGIDKALADLDVKIWSWTDAMSSARAAIKRTLTPRREVAHGSGENSVEPGTGEALAAEAAALTAQAAAVPVPTQAFGFAVESGMPAPVVTSPYAPSSSNGDWAATGSMQWPSGQSATNSNSSDVASLVWPSSAPGLTWPTTEMPRAAENPPPTVASSAASEKFTDFARKSAPARVSLEEAASRADREDALLADLDEPVVRRVRLMRRLDPDTDIEQLIEKARQAQPQESEKAKNTSWWRRK